MTLYKHKVQYYETDKMGITHHSNYIRWMEEARIDCLTRIGWPYDKLEEEGILSPVLGVECKYKESTTFADEINIEVNVKSFNGVRLVIEYIMRKNDSDNIIFTGISENCFLDENSRPMKMKGRYPEFYQTLTKLAENQNR